MASDLPETIAVYTPAAELLGPKYSFVESCMHNLHNGCIGRARRRCRPPKRPPVPTAVMATTMPGQAKRLSADITVVSNEETAWGSFRICGDRRPVCQIPNVTSGALASASDVALASASDVVEK